jgi:hypothetical protein
MYVPGGYGAGQDPFASPLATISIRALEQARQTAYESLHLVGLADTEYHDPERHREVRGTTVELPGGDHGLEVEGDILATLDRWTTMAEAIVAFAARR